ncbi:MAG: 30S ribosomal protein S6 [bacterium]
MRIQRYETVFILEPDLEEARRQEIQERVENIVQKGGGILVKRDDWGVRKLAYDIRRFSKGHYLLLDYAGPSRIVAELERHLKMIESVLRFLTVKQEERVSLEAMEKVRAEERQKEEARKAAVQQRREEDARASQTQPPPAEAGAEAATEGAAAEAEEGGAGSVEEGEPADAEEEKDDQ